MLEIELGQERNARGEIDSKHLHQQQHEGVCNTIQAVHHSTASCTFSGNLSGRYYRNENWVDEQCCWDYPVQIIQLYTD